MTWDRGLPLEEKFNVRVMPEPMSGCWYWLAYVSPSGYGVFYADGEAVLAHRWAYEHFKEPIPPSLQIDHKCFVRCCVNPDHLEPVTCQENVSRSFRAGHINVGGETGFSSKLTNQNVSDIWKLLRSGEPCVDISRRFAVEASAIRRIKCGRTWRQETAALRARAATMAQEQERQDG